MSVSTTREAIKISKTGKYKVKGQDVSFYNQNCGNVAVCTPEYLQQLIQADFSSIPYVSSCSIQIVSGDSLSAAQNMNGAVVLNFADAFTPGGRFLKGGNGREEMLCRNSTLYESISSQSAAVMYSTNRVMSKQPAPSGYMLLSPEVWVFRGNDGRLLTQPYKVAVISAAAPDKWKAMRNTSQGEVDTEMMDRIRKVIRLAVAGGYKNIVLGDWGCGSLGHDPKLVAGYFYQVLIKEQYYAYFENIVFAISDGSKKSLKAFSDTFQLPVTKQAGFKKKSKGVLPRICIAVALLFLINKLFTGGMGDPFPDTKHFDTGGVQDDGGTYTLMIYLLGSDLESECQAATQDLMEMMDSGVDPEQVNLVVYCGGSKYWWAGIPSDHNTIWKLEKDDNGENTFVLTEVLPQKSMGEPETFSEFLNYSVEHYKADHYGLICWDHGSGPLFGYGHDENYGGDSMSLSEIAQALKDSPFNTEHKLDWVGYDACLMSCLETAEIWQDYASYLIASQETEPADGWCYSFLGNMNNTTNPRQIAQDIVDAYSLFYANQKSLQFNPDLTLSCIDLSCISEVSEMLDALLSKMSESLKNDPNGYREINTIRQNSKGMAVGVEEDKNYSLDIVDLGSLAYRSRKKYAQESKALIKSIKKAVIYEKSNILETSGISLYYPLDGRAVYNYAMANEQVTGLVTPQYDSFINLYVDHWLYGVEDIQLASKLSKPVSSESEISWELPEELKGKLGHAYYSILLETESITGNMSDEIRNGTKGTYAPVLTECEIKPDANGVLHIVDDPAIIATKGDNAICWSREIREGENNIAYQLIDANLFVGKMPFVETQRVRSILRENREGELSFSGFSEAGEDMLLSLRKNFDYRDWTDFGRVFFVYTPKTDAKGNILPYSEWEKANTSFSLQVPFSDHFGFEKRKLSELGERYRFVCQFIAEDEKGNKYASDIIPLEMEDRSGWHEKKVNTTAGTLICHEYNDRLEVAGYEGEDQKLVIPDQVDGKTINRILSRAFAKQNSLEEVVLPDSIEEIPNELFSECSNLKKVNIPKSIKRIGAYAFYVTGIQEIVVPEGVSDIGMFAFANCQNLNEIQVEAENNNYKSRDGVLYTKDGKTLVSCPGIGRKQYTVPDGVETILAGAFSGCYQVNLADTEKGTGLTEITFPDSLVRIGPMAFSDCSGFQQIELPDSLISVGAYAFGNSWLEQNTFSTKLKIGKNLKQVGFRAFSNYRLGEIMVDPKNQYLSAKEGRLMTLSGEYILPIYNADEKENMEITVSSF